ncbi:prepilin-type N-terminal cleavage/methylation domain-containing protein [Lysinibacillus sp. 38-6]|uniref:type IV pilus modification PilV family protein n=1 Tax=Lysinibacillus sp. 38-6 TaxID=3385991 RepID=UPI003908AC49
MKRIKSQRGFTLIEVVASLVLISIILLSFAQIFISTNKTAALNNEKLVTVNLADAVLAKVKSESLPKLSSNNLNDYFKNMDTTIKVNDKSYKITYSPSQYSDKNKKYTNSNFTEQELNLIKVVVTITSPNEKTKGSSEGYVSIE